MRCEELNNNILWSNFPIRYQIETKKKYAEY